MQKEVTSRNEILLVGQKIRTNNKTEANILTGKIYPCVMSYFSKNLAEKIANRKNPGTTFCVYTEYESDHTGDYTYFIGEEVHACSALEEGFVSITIPAQKYAKFTTDPGPMPDVIRNAWFEIWQMSEKALGGKRNFSADFEVYDERANDPTHTKIVLDVYIGIT
jgi:predicted transcriptional regulator YdeE